MLSSKNSIIIISGSKQENVIKMDTRYLQTFVIAAEHGSFTKAAQILGYTQSSISFQIKQLETEAGCMLFERINHRITLTDNGQSFLQYALTVLRQTEELKENFQKDENISGHINIGTSDSICEILMLNYYSEFHRMYPGIELEFFTSNTEGLIELLVKNQADVILTLDSKVFARNFIVSKETPVHLHFVTGSSSPLAGINGLSIRDIVDYPFILTEKGLSYRNELEEKLSDLALQIKPVLEMGRTDLICSCLKGSSAISYLPDFVSEAAVASGDLVRLDVTDFNIDIWTQLIYHKNKWVAAPLRAFLNFIAERDFTK